MRSRNEPIRAAAGVLALALLAGCGAPGADARPKPVSTPQNWRTMATAADRDRLRDWRAAFMAALARAQPAHAREIAAAGNVLQPDAALGDATPVPGDYRCRITKLGAKQPGGPDYVAYPGFHCRIAREGDIWSLAKLDGSQRPTGLLFPAANDRFVFLGTVMLGDERGALDYGRDPQRDMAGVFQRIGANRWRLVLPRPAWESMLDVIDFVPDF